MLCSCPPANWCHHCPRHPRVAQQHPHLNFNEAHFRILMLLPSAQALQQLRQRLGASAPEDGTLMWYLRDRYFDVEEAEQKLRAMMKWRAGFRWVQTEGSIPVTPPRY